MAAEFIASPAWRRCKKSGHPPRVVPIMSRLLRPQFTDVPAPRRRNMAAVKGRDTKPELIVRRLLHALGYRYRLHCRDLPGRPDIVLPRRKVAIDVRGCFWHRHPDPQCRNAVLPGTRAAWWAAKLARNVERDAANLAELEAEGWRVLVIWECETRGDKQTLTMTLREFLGPPGASALPRFS